MGWKPGKYIGKGLKLVGKGIKGVTNAIGLTHDTKKDAKMATPEEMEYAKNLINYQAQVDRTQGVANRFNEMGTMAGNNAADALGQQYQARQQQQDALGMARMAATGGAPSVAQAQLGAGLDQSQRQALGLAASGRGNAAANMRNAMQQGAVSAGQANQQAAMLRAGEMAQARDAYAQQAAGIRGADIGREAAYRSLESGYTGQGAQATVGLNTIDNNVANAANKAATDRFDIEQQNAGQLMGLVKTGLEAYGAAKGSDIRAKENIKPAAGAQQSLLGDLQGAFEAGKLEMAMRDAKTPQLDSLGRPGASPRVDTSAFAGMKTPTLDALGASPAGAEGMMRAVKPAMYNYKPESGWDDGRTHIGVMAQDLEKDPIGRQFVTEREDGAKMVDYQAMAPLLLANQAMLQKKVDALKKGKG
jgi:hypothetical protein